MKRSLGTTLAGAALILALGACSSTPPVAEMPEFISCASGADATPDQAFSLSVLRCRCWP